MGNYNSMPLQGLQKSRSPYENESWKVPQVNLKVPNSRLISEEDLTPNTFGDGIKEGESSFDPRVIIDQMDRGLADEYGQRARQEQGLVELGHRGRPGALAGLKADAETRLAESPLSQQRSEYDKFNMDSSSAYNEGFRGDSLSGTPGSSQLHGIQEREAYGRQQAQAKLDQPMKIAEMERDSRREVAGIERAGGLERAQEQSRGLYGQAEVGANVRSELGRMMLEGQIGNGRSLSLTGVGSVGREAERRPLAAGFFNPVNQARQLLEDSKSSSSGWDFNPFKRTPDPNDPMVAQRQRELDSSFQGIMVNHRAAQDVKNMAWNLRNDPNYEDVELPDDWNDDDINDLEELIRAYRGGQ